MLLEAIRSLPPIVALVLGLVVLAWVVFACLMPFMVEGIRQSSRKTHEQLAELNRKMDTLTLAIVDLASRLPERPGAQSAKPPNPNEYIPGRAPSSDQLVYADEAPDVKSTADRTREPKTARGSRPESRERREPTISDTGFPPEPRKRK